MIDAPNINEKKSKKFPYGTLYEYDNGLKILYSYDRNTELNYHFLGGSSSQKFQGQAHFVEHSLFFSGALHKTFEYTNASTSRAYTYFTTKVKHKDLNKINDAVEGVAERSKITTKIVDGIDVFFNEIDGRGWLDGKSPQFTMNYFEEEKNIIDEEYNLRYAGKDIGWNKEFYFYRNQRTAIMNCGNASTLQNITLEDVIKFKEDNYTLENFTFIIRTPLDYDDIEELVVNKLSSRLKSNPMTKVNPESLYAMPVPAKKYFMIPEPTKADVDVVEVISRLDLNPTPETFKDDLLEFYLMRCLTDCYEDSSQKLREEERLVYSLSGQSDVLDDFMSLSRKFSVKKDNVAKILNAETSYLHNCFYNSFDVEKYCLFKSEVANNMRNIRGFIINAFNRNYQDFYRYQNFTDDILNQCQTKLKKMSYKEMQDIIHNAVQKVNFSVIIKGNVEPRDLPSIDYLSDKVKDIQAPRSQYPANMQEDIHKNEKIVDITKPPSMALMVRENELEI